MLLFELPSQLSPSIYGWIFCNPISSRGHAQTGILAIKQSMDLFLRRSSIIFSLIKVIESNGLGTSQLMTWKWDDGGLLHDIPRFNLYEIGLRKTFFTSLLEQINFTLNFSRLSNSSSPYASPIHERAFGFPSSGQLKQLYVKRSCGKSISPLHFVV